MARELSCLRTQACICFLLDLDSANVYSPHHGTPCRDGAFLLRHQLHSRHSSHTLSTTHASRTHVKAPQTDLHVKPDNSSGLTHDSPSEKPLRTKETFQHQKAPKSIENTKKRDDPPSQARTNSPPCSVQTGIGTKARRAASGPRRNPPRCPEPWKKLRKHRECPMAPCHDVIAIEARLQPV